MQIYKYFSADAGRRFFSTWSLRITPPDQFNDPFEMCPPIEILRESDVFSLAAMQKEFETHMARDLIDSGFGKGIAPEFAATLCGCLLGKLSAKEERRLLNQYPQLKLNISAMRQQLRGGIKLAKDQFPMLVKRFESSMHQTMRNTIGALCMSRNGRHPLMWAHYADEHRGLVIEFDSSAPCFNRRRSDTDELGTFRMVCYSDTRPVLDSESGDDWFVRLALTKASEWTYEDEVRFLLELSKADKIVEKETKIHLLDIPPSAVRSITVGCRARSATIDMVKSALSNNSATTHILLRQAHADQRKYELNYVAIPANN
jgi:hypothetical protein